MSCFFQVFTVFFGGGRGGRGKKPCVIRKQWTEGSVVQSFITRGINNGDLSEKSAQTPPIRQKILPFLSRKTVLKVQRAEAITVSRANRVVCT